MTPLIFWKKVSANSDFSIYNIPLGVNKNTRVQHHIYTAIGNEIVDLYEIANHGSLNNIHTSLKEIFNQPYLNAFIALKKSVTRAVRKRLQELLSDKEDVLKKSNTRIH